MGADAITESKRSKKPPCPFKMFDESFTPASLFKSDSTRSPIGPTIPTMSPRITASSGVRKLRKRYLKRKKLPMAPASPK